MKKLLALVVLVVGGFVAYQYIGGSSGGSPEAQELEALQERFEDARSQLAAASRAAGVAGTDTTADAAAAVQEVKRIQADLEKLRPRLSEEARSKAEQLASSLREFQDDLR